MGARQKQHFAKRHILLLFFIVPQTRALVKNRAQAGAARGTLQSGKNSLHLLCALWGGIVPYIHVAAMKKTAKRQAKALFFQNLRHSKFYFHTLRADAFDVYAYQLARRQGIVGLSQPSQVRRKLYKHAIAFHTAHHADNRLPGSKARGIFLPCAQQFFHGENKAPGLIPCFDKALDVLPA